MHNSVVSKGNQREDSTETFCKLNIGWLKEIIHCNYSIVMNRGLRSEIWSKKVTQTWKEAFIKKNRSNLQILNLIWISVTGNISSYSWHIICSRQCSYKLHVVFTVQAICLPCISYHCQYIYLDSFFCQNEDCA